MLSFSLEFFKKKNVFSVVKVAAKFQWAEDWVDGVAAYSSEQLTWKKKKGEERELNIERVIC